MRNTFRYRDTFTPRGIPYKENLEDLIYTQTTYRVKQKKTQTNNIKKRRNKERK